MQEVDPYSTKENNPISDHIFEKLVEKEDLRADTAEKKIIPTYYNTNDIAVINSLAVKKTSSRDRSDDISIITRPKGGCNSKRDSHSTRTGKLEL